MPHEKRKGGEQERPVRLLRIKLLSRLSALHISGLGRRKLLESQSSMKTFHQSKRETVLVSPSHLCARHDRGGGVCLGDKFAIYSTVELADFWTRQLHSNSGPFSRLLDLGTRVAATIPIITSLNDDRENAIVSLPYCPTRCSPAERKPWFLLNAKRAAYHCIIGGNSDVEALLIVLRRPWCVLELCCCAFKTVDALLDFAKAAQEIDSRGYTAAVLLLTHEKEKRNAPWHTLPYPRPIWGLREGSSSLNRIRDVCSAVFAASMHSYNSFWLGLICSCAIEMDIGFSTLVEKLACGSHSTHIIAPIPREKRQTEDLIVETDSSHTRSQLTRSVSSYAKSDKSSDLEIDLVAMYLQLLHLPAT